MKGSTPGRPYKPAELSVCSILDNHALRHETPELNVRTEIRNLSKFRASRKGRIRVNKEVLTILKQVSSELDAAQRHYLAYKQFGDAGESILKLSPELFFLPSDGVAEAGPAGDDDQDGAAADAAAAAGGAATSGAGGQDLLVGHRRWGYFSLLNKLKPVSAKRKQLQPLPQQQARSSNGDAVAPAAEAASEPEDWAEPDSPKASWAELLHQKKRAKEDGIAHMVRVRHAVLVIQRAWRKHLQKRASRALAMMMLRAKVRRAHRAAYVSNLLRRKTPGMSSSSGGEATGEGGGSFEGAADEENIQLTAQQETELQEALQRVLEEGTIKIQDLAELQLTELMDKLNCNRDHTPAGSSSMLAIDSGDGSSETEDEAEEQQQGGWKSISTPKTPAKWPLGLRVDTETPAGNTWQCSLRTPGGSLRSNSRVGTPELDLTRRGISSSGGHRHSGLGSPSECSPPSSNDSGSPRTPGCFGGPDSPKRTSLSRSSQRSAGGVRVGKRMSVVLADAGNAVAIAHGSGSVVVRAKSATRQHHTVSRLNPAAGSRTSVTADRGVGSLPVDGNSGSNGYAAVAAESEQDLLLPGAAGTTSSIWRISLGSLTTTAAATGDLGYPISSRRTSRISFNDEINYLGQQNMETALHASACCLTSGGAAAAAGVSAVFCNGESNREQQWQQQLAQQFYEQCGTPIPDGLLQALAAAAARVGLQSGSQEWHQAMQQMQQHAMQQIKQQQQQVVWQQQQGPEGNSMTIGTATGFLIGMPDGQSCGPGAAMVDAAAAAVAAVLGCGNSSSPMPECVSQASDSTNRGPRITSKTGCTSPSEAITSSSRAAGEASSNPGASAAGVPHYAGPLPPRSSSPNRRSSRISPEDGGRLDDGALWCDGRQPGGTVTSRRATREGGAPSSRGFVTTSNSAAAFSKYERGLGDGLQQDYRVIAAEALLADGRGPAPPPRSRRHSKMSNDGFGKQSLVEQHSAETRPRTRWSKEELADEDNQNQLEEQQQLLLDLLQQQQQILAARSLLDLVSLEGPVGNNFRGDGQAQQRQAQQYTIDAQFDPVAATATVAASMEQYNAAAAAAATAAAGQAGPLMQGLILSQGGVWQQHVQQQQQLRADGWYERLMARKKKGRQPWDPPANTNGTDASMQQQQGVGSGAGKGLAEQERAGSRDFDYPTGTWGRRGKVHNAWLFIDGRQAAALPWQALAAAAAAGSEADSTNAAAATTSARSVEAAALDAAAAFMEPSTSQETNRLEQLSVQGKKLLIKLMWIKSTASVLRNLGRDVGLSQVLERKVLTAIRNNTGPAGKQLLLWSVDDQKQQEQQQQQQLMLCMQLQKQLLMHQQQRLGVLNLSQGLNATGSLQHSYQPPGCKNVLNPHPASPQQQPVVGLAENVMGQHLPLLPAARARALLSKPLPPGQQQQQVLQSQQLLLLLAQQQQLMLLHQQQPARFSGLLAAHVQQLTAAVAAAAAPAMCDQQQSGNGSPLQMQQLLHIQQQLLQQRMWQQQQQGLGEQRVPEIQPDEYSMPSGSSMDHSEVPMVKKLVLARRASRADILAADARVSTAAATAGAAATRERGQDNSAAAGDVKQPAVCRSGGALGRQGICATGCSSTSPAADAHTAASRIQSPAENLSGGNTSVIYVTQQQQGEQQQQRFQWLQPPSAPSSPPPAGSLQVLGALQQQQQGRQAKQVDIGQPSLAATWPSASLGFSIASAGRPGGQQQQCGALLTAQQQQQQGAKAVSFQQQTMMDVSNSIPTGATYVSFVTNTKFQPRVRGKPHRRQTDGSLVPSVGFGSAESSGAATVIPNASNRQRCMRGSGTGAAAATASAAMHVQRVNLGCLDGHSVQGMPLLAGNAQQQQLQLPYQPQQQQLRQGLVPGILQQQQQQNRQLTKSAGSAPVVQQQKQQRHTATSHLDCDGMGVVFSGWGVEAGRRRRSRVSTSDPGSSALLADVQAAAAATAVKGAAGSNAHAAAEKLGLQQAAVSGRKGHSKRVRVMQCTARQARGTDSTAVVWHPQPGTPSADCGGGAAPGVRQQGALVALHQMHPQLPQLAPLRVAVDQGQVGLLQEAKIAESVDVASAVHSIQASMPVLPAIYPGISSLTQH